MGVGLLQVLLSARDPVLAGWSSLGDPAVHEILLLSFDALVLDGQHGYQGFAELREGCARAVLMGKPAIVRVGPGDLSLAGRMADMGASGVILPMVDSAADARAFARALRYMPNGTRSFGPTRAADLFGLASGRAYLDVAAEAVVSFAMIETKAAYADLDAILDVPELGGVFVGPSDLSLALGNGVLDPGGEETYRHAETIIRKARDAGKATAAYAHGVVEARRFADMGCQLIAVSSDVALLKAACAGVVREFRG